MSPSDYVGYYINLDRSPDRRDRIHRQFNELRIADRYERFPAVDGSTLPRRKSSLTQGELGVFASHIAVMELAARQSRLVHVIEDDALLSAALPKAIRALDARGAWKRFDVVLTEMLVSPNLQAIKLLKAKFDSAAEGGIGSLTKKLELIDLSTVNFAGATSYLLTPDSAIRMLPLFRREWEAGPTLPVDVFMRQQAHRRQVRMACAFPFLTSFDLASTAQSTIGERGKDKDSAAILALLRYCFFVESDLQGAAAKMLADLVSRADVDGPDPRRKFLATLLGLIVSKQFELI